MPGRLPVVDHVLALTPLVVEARERRDRARRQADLDAASWLRDQAITVEPALAALPAEAVLAELDRPSRGQRRTVGVAAALLCRVGLHNSPRSLVAAACARSAPSRKAARAPLYWHCTVCGNNEPAQPEYERGDSEPCCLCADGVARVMTLREAAAAEQRRATGGDL